MSRSTYKLMHGAAHCSSRATPPSSTSSSCASSSGGTDETKEHSSSAVANSSSSSRTPVDCPATPSSNTHCTSSDTASTTTPTATNTTTTTTTPMMSCLGSPADEQRRAAAAEARRRRRLLLSSRQNSSSPRRPAARRSPAVTVVPFAGLHDCEQRTGSPNSNRLYPIIKPTIEGVENVAERWKRGLVVAIPTECTYEACLAVRLPPRDNTQHSFEGAGEGWLQTVDQLRKIAKPPHFPRYPEVKDPYCLVTPGCELKRHPILREVFTTRMYALRPSDVEKVAVMYRFNENMEVLERLASKLWPGPILIRLGLSSNSPWTQTPFVVESRPPRIDENDPMNVGPSYKNFVTLRCPRHPLAVKARKDVAADENSLLVSLPIYHSPQASSSSGSDSIATFCTRSRQVAARMAVLDGEDCREVFHVPTCEFGCPCESVIWLDGRQRTVTVQSASPDVCNKRMVQAALRHAVMKKSGNKKERMLIQAIISKWKVVSSTHEDNAYA